MIERRAPVYMVLLHYPIRHKTEDKDITTGVTNIDIHDGARVSATYGYERYYLVTPIEEQASLIHRITSFWVTGKGSRRTPTRSLAMKKVVHATDLHAVCEDITERHGIRPLLIGTSAQAQDDQKVSYEGLQEKIRDEEQPIALVFGTGWGISANISPSFDYFLPPIWGGNSYNHLSVRAAMAITADRLLGVPLPTDG